MRGFVSITWEWSPAIPGHNLPKWATQQDTGLWLKFRHISHISFHIGDLLWLRWAHLLCLETTAISRDTPKMPFDQHAQTNSKSRKSLWLDCQILCPSGTWKIYMPESDTRGFFCTVLPCYYKFCFMSPFVWKKCLNTNSTAYLGQCYIKLCSIL